MAKVEELSGSKLTESKEEKLVVVKDHVPVQVWLISWVTFFERAAYYGTITLFQNYVQNSRNNDILPGALGLGQSRAVTIGYAFSFFTYITPLAGAMLADGWLGRYRSIQIGLLCYILGYAVLASTAFSEAIRHTGGAAGFVIAAILIGMGLGVAKPNLSAFMVDQYVTTELKPKILRNGDKVTIDRDVTIRFIYNVNYWMINIGSLLGILTTFVEKKFGFGYAYLITLGSMLIATIIFHAGRSSYVKPEPTSSVLLKAIKTRTKQFTRTSEPNSNDSKSRSESEEQNESTSELKTALRACWVFIPFPVLTLCLELMNKTLIAQAGQMQTHGLPNDIMFNMNPISVMILLPIVQGWLYPFLASRKISFDPVQRIGVGLFFASVGTGYTTGLQARIYSAGPCFDKPLQCHAGIGPNSVNLALQIPIYIFYAFAEIFAFVAGTELAYTQAPVSLKSLVQALFILFGAFGAIMGIGVSFAAKDPNMVIVYGSLTGAMLFATIAFAILAPWFMRRMKRGIVVSQHE